MNVALNTLRQWLPRQWCGIEGSSKVHWFTFTIILTTFCLQLHAALDSFFDVGNVAPYSAVIEVTHTATLSTGEQQLVAKVVEQITGKPLGKEILIWNGDVRGGLPENHEGRSRQLLHSGTYLVFLEREDRNGFLPYFSSWIAFGEVREGIVHWQKKEYRLADAIHEIPREGIGPK